jgi:DNA-binding NarL/FixJ family response regulator
MAIFTSMADGRRQTSTRVCCEFDLQSHRFEVVELDGLAHTDGSVMFGADGVDLADGVASFSIDGRRFAVRPKETVARADLRMPVPAPVQKSRGVPSSRLTDLLTSREMQIVELVSTGLRNKQIASRLQLSEYTVAAYVKQICHKLQVNNRTAMVSRCFQAATQA